MDPDMHSLGSSSWLLDQRDGHRRPVSTKYETTIFWGRTPWLCPLWPSYTPVTDKPVPSHCDGIASLRAVDSCTHLCPAQQPKWTYLFPMKRLAAPLPCPSTVLAALRPVAAAASGGVLRRMIPDWSHFTVALLSQPNCLFLLFLLLLTTYICLQTLIAPKVGYVLFLFFSFTVVYKC